MLTCRLFVLAILVGSSACGRATEPADRAGSYVLRSVNGRAAPATVDSSMYGYVRVLADTIVLDGAGHATRGQYVERYNANASFGPITEMSPREQPYRIRGASITVGNLEPCPANANCLPTETGTISDSRLTLTGPLGFTEVLVRAGL